MLRLLRDGKDNQSIAQEMGLSVKTIENNLTRLYRQLNVQSRLEAVKHVMQQPQLLGLPGQQVAVTPDSADFKDSVRFPSWWLTTIIVIEGIY